MRDFNSVIGEASLSSVFSAVEPKFCSDTRELKELDIGISLVIVDVLISLKVTETFLALLN